MALTGDMLKSEIARLDDEIARATQMREHFQQLLALLGGGGLKRRPGRPLGSTAAVRPARTRRGGKRIRRSREQLSARAAEMVAFIKAAGTVTGQALNAKFGTPQGTTTKAFLSKYAPDASVKTTGKRSKMSYSIGK